MKTKLIIDIQNDKKNPENMDITYTRRDLQQPKNDDEKAILMYIENLVRFTIDNGFVPPVKPKEDLPNTTGEYNGDTTTK